MADLKNAIRGLECCLNTGNFDECTENCPYFTKKLGVGVCSENMMRDALSLLKEQQSAYERGKRDGVSQYLREREEDEEYEY